MAVVRLQWGYVKPLAEIQEALNTNGTIDGLPFMPEMVKFCGQRVQVDRFANQVCANIGEVEIRQLADTVVLQVDRCDGQAQSGPAPKDGRLTQTEVDATENCATEPRPTETNARPFESEMVRLSKHKIPKSCQVTSICYRCQATELGTATARTSAFNLRQYRVERKTNRVSIGQISRFLVEVVVRSFVAKRELCRSVPPDAGG